MKLKGLNFILLVIGVIVLALAGGGYYFVRSNPPVITPPAPLNSGIMGKATLGPTCPVERPGEICSKPYQGVIVVKNSDKTREVTRFTTDSDGLFRVKLQPGKYYLAIDPENRLPFLKEQLVEVKPDQFTEINLSLDTGIR